MFKKPSQTTSTTSPPGPTEQEAPKPDPLRQGRVKEHKRSILSPAITVNGDISGSEDLMLDGKMEGSISLPDNEVFIGPDGEVKANVTALKVSVEGRLTGDIKSGERVVIRHSGRVEGNIVAPRVVLEDGCQFKGSVEMNIDSESSGSKRAEDAASGNRESGSGTQGGERKSAKSGASAAKVDQYSNQDKSRVSGGS